jgi:hypothetical protein
MSKINKILAVFFIEEYKKGSSTFIIDIFVHITLNLNVLYFLKVCPIFDLQNQKETKA